MSSSKKILLFAVVFIIVGCGKEEESSNAEKVVGYWYVREESSVLLNGIRHAEYVEKYWVDYYDNNCGQIYDEDENPVTEIKWAYYESDDYDRMLISYRLGCNNSLDLFTNELNSVSKFEDNSFRLFKERNVMVGDSMFNTNTFVFHVRQ